MLDNFTRHVGVGTVALISVLSALGMLWQVIHSHDVDPLLAGTLTLTIGLLIPSPLSTPRVTVDNAPDDPVPTADVPAKRRDRGHLDLGGVVTLAVAALIVVLILALLHVV